MANYTKGISRKNVKVPDLESFNYPGHISEFRAFGSLHVEQKCFLVAHCHFGNPSFLIVVINVIKKMLITIIRVCKIVVIFSYTTVIWSYIWNQGSIFLDFKWITWAYIITFNSLVLVYFSMSFNMSYLNNVFNHIVFIYFSSTRFRFVWMDYEIIKIVKRIKGTINRKNT